MAKHHQVHGHQQSQCWLQIYMHMCDIIKAPSITEDLAYVFVEQMTKLKKTGEILWNLTAL